ncbi:MAG: hypothetical protein ABI648_12075 [Betaproteobacteria bacterium]
MSGASILMLAALTAFAGIASAQSPVRIRGTVVSLEGNVLTVKARDGKEFKIGVPANASVVAAKALTFADIKPGDFVGPASRVRPDGALEAISVQVFPAALRGVVPEGHTSWDLEPGSVMTNANVATAMTGASGREINLEYPGGSKKVIVPENAPIFTTVPADRSLLVPGAYIVTSARPGVDGALFTQRIAVSKDGVIPAN